MATPPPPDIQVRSIGHCIYCDNDGSSEILTKEHIVPLSFGGYRFLGLASCGKCRNETHAIEGQCCATIFKALRVHQGIRTRRKKKRPSHLPVIIGATPHGAPTEDVLAARAPGFAPFPILGPPQITLGIPPSSGVDLRGVSACMTTDDATLRQRRLVEEGRPGALAYSEIAPVPFLRTLAKIAHCYVVGWCGLAGFKPLLPVIILGNMNYPAWYVGGIGDIPVILPPPDEKTELHQILPMTMTIRGVDYIATQIRLLANLRPTDHFTVAISDTGMIIGRPPLQWVHASPFAPAYLVIVGEYSGTKGDFHPVII